MDHLWTNFHIKETSDHGEGETCMYSNDADNASSDDEMNAIEQALLQKIHYAEDFDKDVLVATSQQEGNQAVVNDSKSDINCEGTSKRIVKPIRKTEGKSSYENLKGGDNHSERGKIVNQRNVQAPSKNPLPKNGLHLECLTEAAGHSKLDTINDVIVISSADHESASDTESKYKVISKNVRKNIQKLENSEKQCVSNSTNDGVCYVHVYHEKREKLDKTEPHVTPIIVLDSNSDSGSSGNSDVVMVPVNCSGSDLISQEDVCVKKRQWNASKKETENVEPAEAVMSQKVKLKRTYIDMEFRTLLESVKEISSDGSSSDVMLIESHSEDEALDVHCNSNTTSRIAYNYNQELSYRRTKRGRYYQEPRGWPGFKCFNCLQFGHATRDCRISRQSKVITCVLCGTKGHNDAQCPDALCYICSESGHQARECPNKKDRYATCRRCSMTGHKEQRCPDRWRQYHITTEPGEIKHYNGASDEKEVAVNGKVYCYNCSQKGHFGHECWEEPMDRYAPLIIPYVVKYDYIPKRFWNIHVQVDSPEPPVNCQILDQTFASPVKKKSKSRKRFKHENLGEMEGRSGSNRCTDYQRKKIEDKLYKDQARIAVKPAPIPDKKQKIKNKKRKIQHAIHDDENGPQATKSREMTKREVHVAEEKLEMDLSVLPRKVRRKMKKDIKRRQQKDLLHQREVLEDYVETEDYMQKGGHVLRKCKASNTGRSRSTYTSAAEPKVKKIESQKPKKRKRGLWKKQRLKLLKQKKRQQKHDQQQEQQQEQSQNWTHF